MKVLWGDVEQYDQETIISIIRAVAEDDHLRALVKCAVLIGDEELDQIAEVVDSIAVYEGDRYGWNEDEEGDDVVCPPTFYTQQGIGKAKYVVNYHDGKKAHEDGSPFFDVMILRTKGGMLRFTRSLTEAGYTEVNNGR